MCDGKCLMCFAIWDFIPHPASHIPYLILHITRRKGNFIFKDLFANYRETIIKKPSEVVKLLSDLCYNTNLVLKKVTRVQRLEG